jgi:ComEC/Rec2-related protein
MKYYKEVVLKRLNLLAKLFIGLPIIQLCTGIFIVALVKKFWLVLLTVGAVFILLKLLVNKLQIQAFVWILWGIVLMLLRMTFLYRADKAYIDPDLIGQQVFIRVRVGEGVSKHGSFLKHEADLIAVERNGSWRDASGKVLIYGGLYPPVNEGEVWELQGKLGELPEFRDGEFSYEEYLRGKGIEAVMFRPDVDFTGKVDLPIYRKWLLKIRTNIVKKINRQLPEPHSSLLAGILFGIESEMPEDFATALRITGTTHIIAASGYNVGLIKRIVDSLLKFLDKTWRYLLSIILIWLYVIFLGAGIPIVRAGISGTLVIVAALLGRKAYAGMTLIISGAILVFADPSVLSEISFQLSFLATFGMIFLFPSLKALFPGMPDWLEESALSSIAAVLSTLPVILGSFGKVSLISFLANMLVLGVLDVMMEVGIWIVLLPINFFITKVAALLAWVYLEYFVSVVVYLSNFKYAVWDVGEVRGYVPILIMGAIILFVLLFYPREKVIFSEVEQEFLKI